jgi:hypothetical protein
MATHSLPRCLCKEIATLDKRAARREAAAVATAATGAEHPISTENVDPREAYIFLMQPGGNMGVNKNGCE